MSASFDLNALAMVIFLLFGTIANIPFFIRCLADVYPKNRRKFFPAAPPALLTTSFTELCWVLPCLVQCAVQLFNGDGAWSAAAAKLGCDVMGFYSVFASVSGMLSALWIAIITYRVARHPDNTQSPSFFTSGIVGVGVLGLSALIAALPLFGVGTFKYTGEGFCYFDWHHPALSGVLLALTAPTMVATVTLIALTLRCGGWPSTCDLALMILSIFSAWTLWVPATLMGLAGQPFPRHMMIAGGVMGHAQALINPYVYGVRWRRSALRVHARGSSTPAADEKRGAKVTSCTSSLPHLGATPPTVGVVSTPPSPPGSERTSGAGFHCV